MNFRVMLIILLPFLMTSTGLAYFYLRKRHIRKINLLLGIVMLALGYLYLQILGVSIFIKQPRSNISNSQNKTVDDPLEVKPQSVVDNRPLEAVNAKLKKKGTSDVYRDDPRSFKDITIIDYGPPPVSPDSIKTFPSTDVDKRPPSLLDLKHNKKNIQTLIAYGPPPVFSDTLKRRPPKAPISDTE